MIADRRTFHVKPGGAREVAEMIKEQIEGNTAYTGSYRIYLPDIGGSYDTVVVEWEYEDVPAMRAAWEAWAAKPSTAAYAEKWHKTVERGGHAEIWQLMAKR